MYNSVKIHSWRVGPDRQMSGSPMWHARVGRGMTTLARERLQSMAEMGLECIFSEEFVVRLLADALDNLFTLQGQLRVMQEVSTSSSMPIPTPPLQMGTGPMGPSTSSQHRNTPDIMILVQPPRAQAPGMRHAQTPALGSPQCPKSPVGSGSTGSSSLGEPSFAAAVLPITGAIYLWPQMKDQYLFNRHSTL